MGMWRHVLSVTLSVGGPRPRGLCAQPGQPPPSESFWGQMPLSLGLKPDVPGDLGLKQQELWAWRGWVAGDERRREHHGTVGSGARIARCGRGGHAVAREEMCGTGPSGHLPQTWLWPHL